MVTLHTYLGYLVLLLFVIASIMALTSLSGHREKAVPAGLRRAVTGLFDLQILVGIVTFILHPHWGIFILHPILMLIAAAIVHMLTSARRVRRSQVVGYVLATILMIVGVIAK